MKTNLPTVVAHPVTGQVVTINPNKPEYATFRLDSVEQVFSGNFFDERKRTVFITGPLVKIQALNPKAGDVFPGKIIMLESFTPFYPNQEPKINPTTQQVVLKEGRPVYMDYVYDRTGQLHDSWVENAPEVPATSPQEQGAPVGAENPQGANAPQEQGGF